MEEIPPKPLPPTKARVQSYSSWRQASSKVPSKANSEVHRSEITGNSSSDTVECAGLRQQEWTVRLLSHSRKDSHAREQLKQSVFTWKHQKLREIPIPKKDGQTRILKVPTIADRTWQCLVKYALEPACAWQLSTLGVMGSEQGARRKTRKSSCLTTYAPPAME